MEIRGIFCLILSGVLLGNIAAMERNNTDSANPGEVCNEFSARNIATMNSIVDQISAWNHRVRRTPAISVEGIEVEAHVSQLFYEDESLIRARNSAKEEIDSMFRAIAFTHSAEDLMSYTRTGTWEHITSFYAGMFSGLFNSLNSHRGHLNYIKRQVMSDWDGCFNRNFRYNGDNSDLFYNAVRSAFSYRVELSLANLDLVNGWERHSSHRWY